MKTCSFLLASILLALATNNLTAAITSVSFSGPGGTGQDGITGGNLTEPQLIYTSVNYIDVSITLDAAGSYDVNEAPLFGYVRNTTGQAWSGFDLTILPGTTATFTNNWSDFSGQFTTVVQSPSDILFTGGTVANAANFDPNGNFNATGAGTVVIRETPIVVPEPSSVFILAWARPERSSSVVASVRRRK